MTDNEKKFLIGLAMLTRETGVEIGGCGCCGSPFLLDAKITSSESGYSTNGRSSEVRWVDPSEKYYWDKYRNNVVR